MNVVARLSGPKQRRKAAALAKCSDGDHESGSASLALALMMPLPKESVAVPLLRWGRSDRLEWSPAISRCLPLSLGSGMVIKYSGAGWMDVARRGIRSQAVADHIITHQWLASLPPFSSEIKLMIHPMAPCLPSRQETIHVATAGLLSLPCFQVPTSGLVSLNSCLRVFKLNPERRGHRFLLHPQEHADPDWIRGPDGRSFGSTHPGPI